MFNHTKRGYEGPVAGLLMVVALLAPAVGQGGKVARVTAAQTSPANAGTVETVAVPPSAPVWVSHGRVEGHLSLKFSSDGAFSPDSSLLAVVNDDKIMLMDLRSNNVHKAIKPRVTDIQELTVHSANFLAPDELLVFANGAVREKGKGLMITPLLALQWDIDTDHLEGAMHALGAKGGYSPARYFPTIGYVSLYKAGSFDLWNPRAKQTGTITIPDITEIPNLYEFSPDGHWLLLAQVQTASNADPTVVELKTHKFVDSLAGHEGTVLSMAFSRDAKKIVTGCADGKLRIYSVGDWKLLATLSGHLGPVHRAEFSPDGNWIASAGEDHTVRIWSAADGRLLQTLQESTDPLLDVAFSPDGRYIAASADSDVLVWQRQE